MNTQLLTLAAARYGLTPEQLQPLRGGNFAATYGFTRDGADYVLKISPPDPELNAETMDAIWTWVHLLDAHGAPVAGPIPSTAHNLVEAVDTETGSYLVTALKRAPGILAEELPYDQWSDPLFRAWGRTAGKMHAVAQACAADPAALRRPEWDRFGNYFNDPLPEALAGTPMAEQRTLARARLASLPRNPDNYGMIHMDFHAANFFVDPETATVTVFDFDDCCRGWYVMDIAMALFDVLVVYPQEDRRAFAGHFLHQYLAGYNSAKPLDAFWVGQLQHFLKLLETGVYAEVYPYHDPADTTSWVGKFLADDRKGRIERGVPYVDLDFVEVARSLGASM